MSRRRTILLPFIALVAVIALVTGACGGDDSAGDDSEKTTTTAEESTTTADDGSGEDAPTTTVSDADFEASVTEAKEALAAAGDDPCKVMETFESLGMSIGNPTNRDQRKQATELAVAFYVALADAAPADLAEQADQIRATVEKIEQEGEETDYSEEFLNEPEAIKNDTTFNDASGKIMTAFSTQCGDTAPTTAAP
jgi:hypothetical protein